MDCAGTRVLSTSRGVCDARFPELLAAGINDWGGISPVTMDYVNPEARWPHVERLRATCSAEGFDLAARLPIYPEFIDERFVDPLMLRAMESFATRVNGSVPADDEAMAV